MPITEGYLKICVGMMFRNLKISKFSRMCNNLYVLYELLIKCVEIQF